MALSNAERQARHRDRTKEKLQMLDRLLVSQPTPEENNMHGTLARKPIVERVKRRCVSPRTNGNKTASAVDHAVAAAIISTIPSNDNEPYEWIKTEVISTSDWMDIADNPQQRDVNERIAKGRASHLMTFNPSHRKVTVGILPNGNMYKVDGHTRCRVWMTGMTEGPESVIVELWRCRDIQAIMDLYDYFDSAVTMETGADRVTGASRSQGITFESAMLRGGEVSTAIRVLWEYLTRHKASRDERNSIITAGVKFFADELEVFDTFHPTKKRFPTCVVAAALLTLRADRKRASLFWKNYAADKGSKIEGTRDAITVFEARMAAVLKDKNGTRKYITAMREAVAAITAYARNSEYNTGKGYLSIDAKRLRAYADAAFGMEE